MERFQNIKENEDISIIDLLVVLIKYRMLIILGTAIPAIITVLWLFVAKPILKHVENSAPETETKIVYQIRINNFYPRILGALWNDFHCGWNSEIISVDFNNPGIIASLYEENQFADSFENVSCLDYVSSLLKNGEISCNKTNNGFEGYEIVITAPVNSYEKLDNFINSFLQYEMNLAYNNTYNKIQILQERYTRRLLDLENTNINTVNFTDLQNAKDTLEDIEMWISENKPLLEINGSPIIDTRIINSKEPKVKVIIFVSIIALFMFIVIAFLLNTIQNIKADPESSKKIKDAWDSGKIKK